LIEAAAGILGLNLQCLDISRSSAFGSDRDGRIAASDQHEVHQQPRRPPITVVERMDDGQTSMGVEGDRR